MNAGSRMSLLSLMVVLWCSACATTGPPFVAVGPGTVTAGSMQISADGAWNQESRTPTLKSGGQIWTRDGLLLDRLIIVPDIADGETIFVPRDKSEPLPSFSSDMLPNEVAELVESSVVGMFGEGAVTVETSGLRPHRFTTNRGFLFDLEVTVGDGPDYRGMAGGFIAGEKLYLVIFFGADPYYWKKHLPAAQQVIESARV